MHDKKQVDEALKDYMQSPGLTKNIAKEHKISASTLTVWAMQHNLPLRSRGRRKAVAPSARQLKILEEAEVMSLEVVGTRNGLTKQGVHRIVKRWEAWSKSKKAPFAPGDVIEWDGGKYTVIEAGPTSGTVLSHKKNQVQRNFVWSLKGLISVKVGHDRKYATPRERNGHG